MDLKGKVTAIRRGWGGMYPSMPEDEGSKPEVEIQLDNAGGRVCLNVTQDEARSFRLGDRVTVKVAVEASAPVKR